MKKHKKLLTMLVLVIAMVALFTAPVYALTDAEVQAQVDSSGRETVSGNLFIWFLCAISFLKVSQKIDSFMSSLGINVGHTGGSMFAEAAIVARTITSIGKGGGGFKGFGGRGASGASGASGSDGSSGFMSGGLIGVAGRQFAKSATQNATGQSSGGIGGMMFSSSVAKGGDFANGVIGAVAKGNIASAGTISGTKAAEALTSYLGMTGHPDPPAFSDVEIGGGRIMGSEITSAHPNGIEFGMYNADQYMAPEGNHSTVDAVDGSKWYKQYAGDAVEKTPYMAPDGSIAYNESIIQKLPNMPRRKDRV